MTPHQYARSGHDVLSHESDGTPECSPAPCTRSFAIMEVRVSHGVGLFDKSIVRMGEAGLLSGMRFQARRVRSERDVLNHENDGFPQCQASHRPHMVQSTTLPAPAYLCIVHSEHAFRAHLSSQISSNICRTDVTPHHYARSGRDVLTHESDGTPECSPTPCKRSLEIMEVRGVLGKPMVRIQEVGLLSEMKFQRHCANWNTAGTGDDGLTVGPHHNQVQGRNT
jgi:hypothetical protein